MADVRHDERSDPDALLARIEDERVRAEHGRLKIFFGASPGVGKTYAMLAEAQLVSAPIPRPALFLAGKAFQRYHSAGGVRTGVLPDFFIGAHALISNSILITRDAARYRTYFPRIVLIAPN